MRISALTSLLFSIALCLVACDFLATELPTEKLHEALADKSGNAPVTGKPVSPDSILPQDSIRTSDSGKVSAPADTSIKATPVDSIKTPTPMDTLKTPVPVDTTKSLLPVDSTKVSTPTDTVKVGTPVDTTKVVTPVDTAKVVTPVDTAKVVTPVDTAKVVTPVDTTKVVTPVDTTKVVTPVDTAKVVTPVDTTKVVTPVDTTKVVTPVDTTKVVTPIDTAKPTLPGSLILSSDLEDQTASCWDSRGGSGYTTASCGPWSQVGGSGARLSVGGTRHSGTKSLAVTFSQNEEVAGASLPISAEVVNVRAWYNFAAGFDFGQGVKIGRLSSFNTSTQMNDVDIIMTVRSSGSVNQCGLTDMADLGLFFNGRPVGYDWGNITATRTFERGRWYAIEYQVILNTPGQRNGSVKLWVDGVQVASKTGINIRGNGGSGVKMNRLRVGGWYSNGANGNSCTHPSQPSTMFVDDVAVGAGYIGPN